MTTLDKMAEDFKRSKLDEILNQCTPAQREMFHQRIFPNGVPADKLDSAYDLCERTMRKNLADPSRTAPKQEPRA
jgi:hypothetical protein